MVKPYTMGSHHRKNKKTKLSLIHTATISMKDIYCKKCHSCLQDFQAVSLLSRKHSELKSCLSISQHFLSNHTELTVLPFTPSCNLYFNCICCLLLVSPPKTFWKISDQDSNPLRYLVLPPLFYFVSYYYTHYSTVFHESGDALVWFREFSELTWPFFD